MKSKAAEFSEYIQDTYVVTKQSISNRKLKYGVGVNDADYVTQPIINEKKIACPAYGAWHEMLKRGFSKKYKEKFPTYKEVEVCEEWLTFSNFRKWWLENHVDNYELDKDLLIMDNKIYSPRTCIYIPSWLNSFLTNCDSKGECKTGVHKVRNKYRAECQNQRTKNREHLGYFDTEEDAFQAWKTYKISTVEERKEELDNIDPRLYTSLIEKVKSMK